MADFVIQEHKATHLHWDFRLEMDEVLKSWAIPKEPKADPKVKRLAIEVDDHPLEHIDFEGEIEEGQYGAGIVKIWDRGTYDLIERTKNHIKFRLHGEKLKGTFHLIKTKYGGKKNSWLFFKGKED